MLKNRADDWWTTPTIRKRKKKENKIYSQGVEIKKQPGKNFPIMRTILCPRLSLPWILKMSSLWMSWCWSEGESWDDILLCICMDSKNVMWLLWYEMGMQQKRILDTNTNRSRSCFCFRERLNEWIRNIYLYIYRREINGRQDRVCNLDGASELMIWPLSVHYEIFFYVWFF